MSGLLTSLVAIEVLLTLVLAALYVYDRRLQFNENDSLVLDHAEEHLMAGQAELRAKANRAEYWLKYTGIGWLVLGVATLGVFVAEGIGVM